MKNVKKFQQDLIAWFQSNQRDLPWRKDKNPYKIWVSEIMLQQTKVDTVIPYFHSFIEKFPTIEVLAIADEQEVLKKWEGLGYYSRARNLHAGAKQIINEWDGKFPKNYDDILKIKGIGSYTAGAICSIAFGNPTPAVDGNVMRVYSRLFSVWDDIAKEKTKKTFQELVRKTIDEKNTSSFNQGIMELGALICTPTSPKCDICPVQIHCSAFKENVAKELPVKSKKKSPKTVNMVAIVIKDEKENIIIHKRPENGLLANLWEFPNTEISTNQNEEETIKTFMKDEYGVEIKITKKLENIEHTFSHLKWDVTVYIGEIQGTIIEDERKKVVPKTEIEKYPYPVSHQKIWKNYKKKREIN